MLVQKLLSKDFLSYDFHLTTNLFFDTLVRYAEFFKANEQYLTTAVQWFFSEQGIRSPSRAIASHAINLFLRLMEKFRHQAIFAKQGQVIAQHLMNVIQEREVTSNNTVIQVAPEGPIGHLEI